MSFRLFAASALIAALLQTAALGQIVFQRASLLMNGTEIMLRSRFVDPRDLFRGHYVTLNLDVGSLAVDDVAVRGTLDEAGVTVFIELKKSDDLFWQATALHAEMPEETEGPVIAGEYLGKVTATGEQPASYRISLPFDRYFAPRLRAKELENVRDDGELGVVLAVGASGAAAIKGIVVNGEVIYEEPLL